MSLVCSWNQSITHYDDDDDSIIINIMSYKLQEIIFFFKWVALKNNNN